jgi:hypothetical protein
VQPAELLSISLALRAMRLDKIKLSYWQEYDPGIKTRVWF